MECCARAQFNIKSNPFSSSSDLSSPVVSSQIEIKGVRIRNHQASTNKFFPSLRFQGHGPNFSRRTPSLVTSAIAESSGGYESRSLGTPLEPQTPEGKFLCGMLKNHPHIFSVAASEQLEELATNRENAFARYECSADSEESCLHERIAEMKELECQIAIEEVMHLLVVHRFYEIKVPMIPNLSRCTTDGKLEIWSSKIQELESIYEPEILEMVREHISNILRLKATETVGNWYTIKIKRLQLGRIYAASIMYGYFLKSVYLRHCLELSLPSLHQMSENLVVLRCFNNNTSSSSLPSSLVAAEKLRGYMMSFDSKTLQICAKLRSREATKLIEKHTWALFGYPDDRKDDDGEIIAISASGLRRLVLEAVAFGSFLWEVERYVDSVYRLKDN